MNIGLWWLGFARYIPLTMFLFCDNIHLNQVLLLHLLNSNLLFTNVLQTFSKISIFCQQINLLQCLQIYINTVQIQSKQMSFKIEMETETFCSIYPPYLGDSQISRGYQLHSIKPKMFRPAFSLLGNHLDRTSLLLRA